MNKIKASFSQIKATEEFKDKLEKELLNTPINLISKTNSYKNKFNYKIGITAAAVSLIFLGGVGFKLHVKPYVNTSSDSSAISTIEKSSEDKEYAMEDSNDNDVKGHNQSDTNNIIKSSPNDNETFSNSEMKTTPKVEGNTVHATDNNNPNSSKDVVTPKQEIKPSENNIEANNVNTDSSNNTNSNDISLFSTARIASNSSVFVPKIELPKPSDTIYTKMIPLIVYKGRIYTYSPIEITPQDAKKIIGKKLGTTKANINEWSTQSEYSTEFASNIGITDVYSVNGYDEDFRIMTNLTLENGTSYPEFYECLNGITINNGEDFFGKFKLQGNISSAKFQTFSDWNNGTGTFYSISDNDLINSFIDALNKSTPILPENIDPSLGDYRNDSDFKNITFNLKDGYKNITFTVLKSGYVFYGYPKVYFKIDNKLTDEIWDKLGIMKIN